MFWKVSVNKFEVISASRFYKNITLRKNDGSSRKYFISGQVPGFGEPF